VRPRGQIPVLKKQTKYLHIIISGGQGPLGVYEYWVTITVLLAQSHMPDMTLNCSTWEAESEGLSLRLAWATKIICFKKKKKEKKKRTNIFKGPWALSPRGPDSWPEAPLLHSRP
jgi:hypothetical protein